MTAGTQKPAIGAWVYHEGDWYNITQVAPKGEEYQLRRDAPQKKVAAADLVFFESEEIHARPSRGGRPVRARPRFRVRANLADLRWSDEFEAWYLWGRTLAKGKGRIAEKAGNPDQRRIVAELRDRGLLPGRATRQPGSVPAGGEHENLAMAMFCDTGINWEQELANVQRGDGLSENAHAAVANYAERFKRPLARGYAEPDANDSKGEG